MDYASAGVDLAAAAHAKERMKKLVESTFTSSVVGGFGGFGGMFRLPAADGDTVLVASADGVGTKIKVAIAAGRHDSIGHDLVNHCVNDILVQGATPLFFLDYLAFATLDPAVAESLVAGVAAGCRENGCALIGGETAQMPGVYTEPDYDLAGFIVGQVAPGAVLGAERVTTGDELIALASSGLHTNGYSLARRVLFERMGLGTDDNFPGERESVADVLLRVHRSYLAILRPHLGRIHAMAHITGGGIPGNLNRVLPGHLSAVIDRSTWTPPNLFRVLAEGGDIEQGELFNVFNMGVGMIVVCDSADAASITASSAQHGVHAWRIGKIAAGDGTVVLS
jgi:phosphoribosylformylglycinamidine cyclo-ligase